MFYRKFYPMAALLFLLDVCFFMLGFSEGIVSHVRLPFFFLISGNLPLIACFVLRSKIIFNNFTFSLMYYNNFVLKIIVKICLFPLLCNLKVIWALNDLMLPNNKLTFVTNNVKGIQSFRKRLKLIQYFKSKIGPWGLLILQETHSNSKVE